MAFSGRVDLVAESWLADHAIFGTTVFPGAAVVEMALRAIEGTGCRALEELTLHAPLTFADGAVRVQVVVGEAELSGRRPVEVYSRPVSGGVSTTWTRHAAGHAVPKAAAPVADPDLWLPRDAVAVDVPGFYPELADRGYGYGPAFRALNSLWRHGDEVYGEVRLPEHVPHATGGFAVHPALFDAALHTVLSLVVPDDPEQAVLPYSWDGVTCHARAGDRLRVRAVRTGETEVSLTLTGCDGTPVLTVDSLALMPASASQLSRSSLADSLFGVRWTPVEPNRDGAEPADLAHVEAAGHGDAPAAARASTRDALDLVRRRLSAAHDRPLAIVTRNAVAALPGEAPDLALAPCGPGALRADRTRGPVRPGGHRRQRGVAARAGDAGRAHAAGGDPPRQDVRTAAGHRARRGQRAARLGPGRDRAAHRRHRRPGHAVRPAPGHRAQGAQPAAAQPLRRRRTGRGADRTGRPRHRGGLRRLRRRGAGAAARPDPGPRAAHRGRPHGRGAGRHHRGVDDAGADRPGVRAQGRRRLATAPAHPGHGPVGLRAVLLRRRRDRQRGTVQLRGGQRLPRRPGRAPRRGGPARALAGLGPVGDRHGQRPRRRGPGALPAPRHGALTAARGTALFDAALTSDVSLQLPVRIDRAALRQENVPEVFRTLVQPASTLPEQPAAAEESGVSSVARRLAALSPQEQREELVDLLLRTAAEVLGYPSADDIDADMSFQEIGFDSLSGVEFRNQVKQDTGCTSRRR
ncbi:polyketide synthase dehydratase domain-containing protein [Streptomyces sp. M19]